MHPFSHAGSSASQPKGARQLQQLPPIRLTLQLLAAALPGGRLLLPRPQLLPQAAQLGLPSLQAGRPARPAGSQA